METSGLINNLYTSIINYKAEHKYRSTENYIQSEPNWGDDKMFFTDRHYQRNRLMRGRQKGVPSLFSRFSSQPVQHTKKCFVCGKVSCWLTNYTQQEHDKSKRRFNNCYPKYKARPTYERDLQHWITKYKDIEDDKHVAQYFGDLSINI